MEVEAEFGEQVNFVGVPGLASVEDFDAFVESTGTTDFDHVSDADGEIWERFGVTQQRTYIYINDDGTWEQGSYGTLGQRVEELIAS